MTRIGIRELRQNASTYVRLARQGEAVEICDRGEPVAMLVPVSALTVLQRLELQGRLTSPAAEGGADDPLLALGEPLEPATGPGPGEVLRRRREQER